MFLDLFLTHVKLMWVFLTCRQLSFSRRKPKPLPCGKQPVQLKLWGCAAHLHQDQRRSVVGGAQNAVHPTCTRLHLVEICDLAHRTAGETGKYVLAPKEEKVISWSVQRQSQAYQRIVFQEFLSHWSCLFFGMHLILPLPPLYHTGWVFKPVHRKQTQENDGWVGQDRHPLPLRDKVAKSPQASVIQGRSDKRRCPGTLMWTDLGLGPCGGESLSQIVALTFIHTHLSGMAKPPGPLPRQLSPLVPIFLLPLSTFNRNTICFPLKCGGNLLFKIQ